MPFCASCGSPVEGRFCPKCGAAIDGGAAAGGPGGAGAAPAGAASTGMQQNMVAALCYLGGLITGILFLVLEPYNRNKTIRFHAFQSIFLTVAFIVVHFLVVIVGTMTAGIFFLLSPLIWLFFFLVWLYMMWKAYNNEKILLPVIGPLAEKQA